MQESEHRSGSNRRKTVGIVCVFGAFALGLYSAGFIVTKDEATTTALRLAVIVGLLAVGFLLGKALEKSL